MTRARGGSMALNVAAEKEISNAAAWRYFTT